MSRESSLIRFGLTGFFGLCLLASCGGTQASGDGEGGEGGEGGAGGEAGATGEGGSGGGGTNSDGGKAGGSGGSGGSKSGGAGGSAGGGGGVGGKGGGGAGGIGTAGSGGAAMGGSGGAGGMAMASPLEFYQQECATCHGDKGQGTKDGPELQHPVRAFAKEVIRKGRTGHPDYKDDMGAYPVADLSDAALNTIFDFLDSPPKPTTGKALYVDYCQNCHGTKGNNGLAAHAVNTHIADIPRLVRDGHGGTSYLSRTSYMPAWTAQQLTDAELKLIADAIPTL